MDEWTQLPFDGSTDLPMILVLMLAAADVAVAVAVIATTAV